MDKPIIRIQASSFANTELSTYIDFPITESQLNDVFRNLHIENKEESEICFDDITCEVNGVFDVVHPDACFEDINRLALEIKRMSEKNKTKLSRSILTDGVLDGTKEAMDIKDCIILAQRLNRERQPPLRDAGAR